MDNVLEHMPPKKGACIDVVTHAHVRYILIVFVVYDNIVLYYVLLVLKTSRIVVCDSIIFIWRCE